jgi:hypothetical protein
MKTFIQLSADGAKAHWKFQAEEAPVFAKEIILVDITDLQPQPEEGWLYDGAKFTPPPPPPLEELLIKLQRRLQAYIYTHYDQGTQATLTAIFSDPAIAKEVKDEIMLAWGWVKQVLYYYYGLKMQLVDGLPLESLHIDFEQFDAVDPKVSLEKFIKG